MTTHPLVLIDLSSIAHPLFHQSGSEPDPNWTSARIVERIRALASGQPHVAICCDAPPYLRKQIEPSYKANRPESDAALHHQIALAVETLRGDGFPVWAVTGFEADDLIASAVAWLPNGDETRDCLIVSADKDLLQLVGPRVSAKSLRDGSVIDEAAVVAKFAVRPDQMRDYLTLVGDASDNIKGARGIGEKRASELLAKHGTLDAIMTPEVLATLTPALKTSLEEFAIRLDTVRTLITLRSDVPVPIEEAFVARVPVTQESAVEEQQDERDKFDAAMHAASAPRIEIPIHPPILGQAVPPATEAMKAAGERVVDDLRERAALVPQVMPAPAPAEWSMQLEPRSIDDAWRLAQRMFESRLFSAYGTTSAVLSTIMAGREIGLQAMASLRAFHIIEGRPTLSAGIIQAMVIKSEQCEYFRCTERTNERATFETKRRDNPPMALTFTLEDAKMAGVVKQGSGWTKNPADMLVARAATKLARLVYPDICSGLYAPEEF